MISPSLSTLPSSIFSPESSSYQPPLEVIAEFERMSADTDSGTDNTAPPLVIFPEFGDCAAKGETRSLIVRGVNSYPTIVPIDDVILGKSYGRKGDILNFVSGAGMGKSVVGIQAPMAWALGLPYLGITPARPVRSLIFSGEDDGVTIGQCREGFLENSLAITGEQLTAADLAPLDSMIRTEFSRSHVGARFHLHLAALLRAEPADLIVINPLLSYVGGEIVACGSEWLRAGLMPVLQAHECLALILHHTPKLSKDSWENMDDTYSAIGGGEIANIPRSVLTLKPTPAPGLFVVTVSKRQTTGWKDGNGKFTTSHFIRRTDNPERPAWLPVDYEEAMDMIAGSKSAKNANGAGLKKATAEHVVEALRTGAMQQVALVDWIRKRCGCSENPAKDAIRAAAPLIVESFEKNPRGGHALKWLTLKEHTTQGVE